MKNHGDVRPFLGNPWRNPAGCGGPHRAKRLQKYSLRANTLQAAGALSTPESGAFSCESTDQQCIFYGQLVVLGPQRARRFYEPCWSYLGTFLGTFWPPFAPASGDRLVGLPWGCFGAKSLSEALIPKLQSLYFSHPISDLSLPQIQAMLRPLFCTHV